MFCTICTDDITAACATACVMRTSARHHFCVNLDSITAWWMAKWPQTFYLWYTGKSLILYGLRFLIYK